jgi:hypothetical protein
VSGRTVAASTPALPNEPSVPRRFLVGGAAPIVAQEAGFLRRFGARSATTYPDPNGTLLP